MRERAALIHIWEESVPARGNTSPQRQEPPGVLEGSSDGRKARGEMLCEVRGVQVAGPPDPEGQGAIVRTLAFTLSGIRGFLKSLE